MSIDIGLNPTDQQQVKTMRNTGVFTPEGPHRAPAQD